MIKSLRRRLQLWYALVLLVAVGGFGTIIYGRTRAAVFEKVDTRLQSAALVLEASLRSMPYQALDPNRPPPPLRGPNRPPFGKGKDGDKRFESDMPMPDRPPGEKRGPRPGDKFGPFPPRDKGMPPRDRDGPPREGPPRELIDRLIKDMNLPAEWQNREGENYAWAVWRYDGQLLKAMGWPEQPPDRPAEPFSSDVTLLTRDDLREARIRGPADSKIVVARSVRPELDELNRFAWMLAAVGAAVLGVGLVGGWLVSARIFRPVALMTQTAATISASNLSARIDTSHVDTELAQLAEVLNAAFGRLEAAFDRQARFTADASHELRTPLAIVRTHTELALARPRSSEQYRETIETCQRASKRMAAIVDGLLALARADAGHPGMQQQRIELDRLVAEATAQFQPIAQAKQVALTGETQPVSVTGDPGALIQVVGNLVSNAIHYNREGGKVEVRVGPNRDGAVLEVRDTGCGIPAADLPHVFERFYRVDKARARASGGTGLGLAIAKDIVEAHGGTIDVESAVGEGTRFTVRLPTG